MKHRCPLILVLALPLLAGCGRPSAEVAASRDSAPPAATSGADPHDGHDHAHGSGHVHRPLMGGQLVELGEHRFNLEFKYDATRGVLQAWVLDAHAENFVRLAIAGFTVQEEGGQQRTIALHAVGHELSDEKPGDTSSFEGAAPWLGEIPHFDGRVQAITVREVEFRDIDFHFHPQG